MKVLWFTNTPCGAAEKLEIDLKGGGWLTSLEDAFVQLENIELFVCFYYQKKINPFYYKKVTYYPIYRKIPSTKIERYFCRLFNKSYNDRDEISELISIVKKIKPDIIHVHGTEDNFGLIQKYVDIPVVISLQGILNPLVEKYFSGISKHNVILHESRKAFLLKKSKIDIYCIFVRYAKRESDILKMAKYLLGRTDWDRQVTRCLAPNSSYFINNEILRESFYKHEWNKTSFGNPIKLVTITSDNLYKGFETIVKTTQLLQKIPNFPFKWTIIGLNNDSGVVKLIERWLTITVANLPLQFVGFKSESEVVKLLKESDIYCQVSHIENSPNSLCEAMLLGMPVIATFAGGTNSLLSNKKDGLLVQEGEPYSYAGAIYELANNYTTACQFGRFARINALKIHDKRQITTDLISTYQAIIQGYRFSLQ